MLKTSQESTFLTNWQNIYCIFWHIKINKNIMCRVSCLYNWNLYLLLIFCKGTVRYTRHSAKFTRECKSLWHINYILKNTMSWKLLSPINFAGYLTALLFWTLQYIKRQKIFSTLYDFGLVKQKNVCDYCSNKCW